MKGRKEINVRHREKEINNNVSQWCPLVTNQIKISSWTF